MENLDYPLPWVQVSKTSPYFVTDDGRPWTPIGQNDAISWPDLRGCLRRRDLPGVESYLRMLAANGATCLRLMLEYSQEDEFFLESPAGTFRPELVQLWDDLFALCTKHGLRIFLTPFDTYWMWLRWDAHPYNRAHGGPCAARAELLTCRRTRAAIKARLAFATERWGNSGALFAWDLWNEIHPRQAGGAADTFYDFIGELSDFLRQLEMRLHGRSHPLTVSVFTPALSLAPTIADSIFRHPALDFACLHLYELGVIDDPRNTVDPALCTGRLLRKALGAIRDWRPFFDGEHGPIHSFKDGKITLPAEFDDEYFRHMQWAHFASGGAGGGMRWPNRAPHTLTPGMRAAQRALALFLPLIDWSCFRRKNLSDEIETSRREVACFACADEAQAVVWLLRVDQLGADGRVRADVPALAVDVRVPGLRVGQYVVTAWDTKAGARLNETALEHRAGSLLIKDVAVRTDVALAIRRVQ